MIFNTIKAPKLIMTVYHKNRLYDTDKTQTNVSLTKTPTDL